MVQTGWLPGYPCFGSYRLENEVVESKYSSVACWLAFWIFFCTSWRGQGPRNLEFSSEPSEPYPWIQPPRALQTKGWKLRHASLEMRHVGIAHHRYVPVIQIQSLPPLVVQFRLNYLNLSPPNSRPPGYSGESTRDFEIWHVFQMYPYKGNLNFPENLI